MNRLDTNIVVFDEKFKYKDCHIGMRMTVLRLKNGQLWIHSPIPLAGDVKLHLEELGPVGFVVAPNESHVKHIKDYMVAYSTAEFLGAPGLREQRPDLKFTHYFRDEYTPQWRNEIDFVIVNGSRQFNEVVFLHKESKTLIITDMASNLRHKYSFAENFIYSYQGVFKDFKPSRMVKSKMTNLKTVKSKVEKILDWDFDRIIMSHGRVINSQGHDKFEYAYSWLID